MALAVTQLKAEVREAIGTGRARRLRRKGMIPVVLYGHGEDTVHLSVSRHDLQHAIAAGVHVLSLQTAQGVQQVLVKEVQYDALGTDIVHADFARIAMDEAITVQVPVELHGTLAEAGVINHLLHTMEVRCRADRIPEKLRVEITGHRAGDAIRVSDVAMPEGVTPVPSKETVVVAILAPTEVEEVAAAAAGPEAAAAEPEVITARREKEEEEVAEGESREGGTKAAKEAKAPEKPEKK